MKMPFWVLVIHLWLLTRHEDVALDLDVLANLRLHTPEPTGRVERLVSKVLTDWFDREEERLMLLESIGVSDPVIVQH